jgi:prepilin-type N-terminal cleavage/methylation domain-containing protein
MSKARTSTKRGFSLLEMVIVVVIIGIIAAIAIPRMSRGSAGAADAAVAGNLAVLRSALDLFAAEHGGSYPTQANVVNQLTQYSDATITTATGTVRSATTPNGPYLRSIPICPEGPTKGSAAFTASGPPGTDTTCGWYYNPASGEIRVNAPASAVDSAGVVLNTY